MGRVVIDLPDEDLRLLDVIKDVQKKPRAEIIRLAISGYLENNRVNQTESAFGIWQMAHGDGMAYQTALREEWPE